MPHLLFRGVNPERLQVAAPPLVDRLAEVCDCGADQFTLNALQVTNIYGSGPNDPPFAFVEIGWFERGAVTRAKVADAVTDTIINLGIPDVEIVFHTYSEQHYYINGVAVAP
ncbi:DUF1904 family protein [Paenibacillus sp. strain BS8-2]